ncbi:MAG: hypothetical protein IH944_06680 [Armatimonadetes bacterium]|nr:hypothetical protein [Armatimonadota bacterium]
MFAFVAVVVVIGCGGGGGTGGGGTGGGTGGGGGTTGGPTAPTVVLDTDSTVQYLLLTGANRRAGGIGDQFVVMRNIKVQNDVFDFAPTSQGGASVIQARLNGYKIFSSFFTYTIQAGDNFKTFVEYPMEISGMKEQTGPGEGDITDLFTTPEFITPPFALNLVLLRGRQHTIQINLDESIVFYDLFTTPKFNFDRAGFEDENYDPIDNSINSFLSDYISFDISNMAAADRPNMVSTAEADKILISGDAIAMAAGFDTDDSFEVLNPVFLDQGRFTAPDPGPPPFPGTYSVFEDDPRDLIPPIAQLIALQGIWKDYSEVLTDVGTNVGNEAVIAFPNSRQDTESMTVVYFKRDVSGNIIALWQGVIRLSGAQTNTIIVSPIDDLPSGILAGEARGTLSNLVFLNGEVIRGEFTFVSGPGLPGFPFSLAGEFAVFIR